MVLGRLHLHYITLNNKHKLIFSDGTFSALFVCFLLTSIQDIKVETKKEGKKI